MLRLIDVVANAREALGRIADLTGTDDSDDSIDDEV
jgi:hypothetical protein